MGSNIPRQMGVGCIGKLAEQARGGVSRAPPRSAGVLALVSLNNGP